MTGGSVPVKAPIVGGMAGLELYALLSLALVAGVV